MNIEQICQRFQKAYPHYQQNAIVQQTIVRRLLVQATNWLPHRHFQQTLEIGCGTGNLTQHFLEYYTTGIYYLNDLYDDIKTNHQTISQHITHPDWRYLIGDIQNIILPDTPFDIILSSSALQWIYPLDDLLVKLHKHLKPEGYFIFSSFLNHNLTQIKALTHSGLDYYDMNGLQRTLEQVGFQIKYMSEHHDDLYFNQPYDILKHLKATGVTATQHGFTWNKQRLQQFYHDYHEQFYQDSQTNGYPLTYHSVYVIAQK